MARALRFPRLQRSNISTLARAGGRVINAQQRRDLEGFWSRLGSRMKASRGRTQTLYTRKYTRSAAGLLGGTNADLRRVYRKGRMPLRKKRNWRRFIKRVHAVSEKELGSRTVLFNDAISQTNTLNSQSSLTLCLYPGKSAAYGWLNDLGAIASLENVGNPTAAAGVSTYGSTKYLFQTGVLDLTLRNDSTFQPTDAASRVLDGRAALELDIYEFIVNSEASDNPSVIQNFSQILASYDDSEIGGTGTGISIADRGATPFEFGTQMGHFKVKILKKTKYFIPNNQTITHQIRDPRRRVATQQQMNNLESFNMKGWTRGLYLVYKLVPGVNAGISPGDFQQKIMVGITRKYMYKIEGATESRERLLGASYAAGTNV